MRRSLILTFVSGLAVGFLLSKGSWFLPTPSVQAAALPVTGEIEFGKNTRPEIERIVLSEFEKYATDAGLTAEGEVFVQGIAKEKVAQFLTQETSRQVRNLQKAKAMSLNYNKSQVPSPVAMSSNGQTIVVSGSEGVLVSQDGGNSWEKVVKD